MQPIKKELANLRTEIEKAVTKIGLNKLLEEQKKLIEQSKKDDFWNNSETASSIMQKISNLEKRTKNWLQLDDQLNELDQLIQLDDEKLLPELEKQTNQLNSEFQDLKAELRYDGSFDDHDAIISIYAGAGGTDAQDWTQILLRMYIRWAEQQGYQVKTITESPGDEAGLKSVTVEITGEFVYGKLKGEHGVHRLVRLSPFNANNLRETSFAKVEILPMINQPTEVEMDEKDLQIDVFRSGGHGGQSVNTTDSAVRVTHIPTGLTVSIQNERSQLQNRETALTILRSRLVQLQLDQHINNLREIKGPNQSAEWGNQIRSYVMHPYKQVKDLRTRYETSDIDGVLKGNINEMIDAYLESNLKA